MEQRKMTVYISGPITGIEDDNLPLFREWEDKLQQMGYETIVPHDLNPDCSNPDWHDWMRACIKALMDADLMVCIQQEKFSRGVEVESLMADRLNIPRIPFANIKEPARMIWPNGSVIRNLETSMP